MNLDGKRLVSVQKLEQQRELPLRMVPAEQFQAVVRDQLAELHSAQLAERNHALIRAMVDDFPTFRVILACADRLVQNRSQPAATPKITTEQRLES